MITSYYFMKLHDSNILANDPEKFDPADHGHRQTQRSRYESDGWPSTFIASNERMYFALKKLNAVFEVVSILNLLLLVALLISRNLI